MPVAHLPRDQLPVLNRNGQLQSGVPFQTASSYAPSQSTTSTRYVNTPGPVVYDVSHVEFEHIIDHLDRTSLQDLPADWLKLGRILCDSGASASVAPPSFAAHIKMEPFQHDITLKAATSEPIDIIGCKDIHLISEEVEFDDKFYITNVKRPLLGLADILSSNISMNISRHKPNIYSKGKTTDLIIENNKLLLEAILVPAGEHILPQWVSLIQHNVLNADQEFQADINIEARRPKSLRSPSRPSSAQIEEHNLTHQPFRSWCPICQQTRGRPSQHRRRGEESSCLTTHSSPIHLIHLWLAADTTASPPFLSMVESITGMSYVIIAIMTHKKGITKHRLHQAKKWTITNGFSDATIQCDAETSLIQLTEKIASELGLQHRVSPPYSHQSQGRVERLIAPCMSRSEPSGINGQPILVFQYQRNLLQPYPGSFNMLCSSSNATSFTTMAAPTSLTTTIMSMKELSCTLVRTSGLRSRTSPQGSWTAAMSLRSSEAMCQPMSIL